MLVPSVSVALSCLSVEPIPNLIVASHHIPFQLLTPQLAQTAHHLSDPSGCAPPPLSQLAFAATRTYLLSSLSFSAGSHVCVTTVPRSLAPVTHTLPRSFRPLRRRLLLSSPLPPALRSDCTDPAAHRGASLSCTCQLPLAWCHSCHRAFSWRSCSSTLSDLLARTAPLPCVSERRRSRRPLFLSSLSCRCVCCLPPAALSQSNLSLHRARFGANAVAAAVTLVSALRCRRLALPPSRRSLSSQSIFFLFAPLRLARRFYRNLMSLTDSYVEQTTSWPR